jgi:ABC-type transport system involved in multi-copper enzyme maturation permease subunit
VNGPEQKTEQKSIEEESNHPPSEDPSSPGHSVTLSPCHLVTLSSSTRAWFYLIWLSIERQARARQMVWIAMGLLVFTATIVALNTAANRWTMGHWRPEKGAPRYQESLDRQTAALAVAAAPSPISTGIVQAATGADRAVLHASGFVVFSRWLVWSVFVGFLLPIWSLSFATEAVGGERESRSLVWLLSRPLSRPAIYSAKFIALLPWTLGLNVGGFAVLCIAAGAPGRMAFSVYWPAVVAASLAFCSLFHLMSAVFRRPAVMAILYSFFLETFLGSMPGYMKRVSIGFYTRCLMFDAASAHGVEPPERPGVYLPVDPTTAWMVLLGLTASLLVVGMLVFARSEYWEDM